VYRTHIYVYTYVYMVSHLREGALQLGKARSLSEEQVGARLVTVRGAVRGAVRGGIRGCNTARGDACCTVC
jgi:hypothetical protein